MSDHDGYAPQSLWSWISIDESGHEKVLDLDKYEIMDRFQIRARDLRILDPNLSYPPVILGRERAIVLNLEHIKMVITANEVLLRDPSDENVMIVLEELRRRLPVGNKAHHGDVVTEAGEQDEFPFELRALEVALEAICSFLAARTTELETVTYPALDDITSKISSRSLGRVPELKSAITGLTARVEKVRDELEQLLDDDDDMAELCLSKKLVAPLWHSTSPTIGVQISRASSLPTGKAEPWGKQGKQASLRKSDIVGPVLRASDIVGFALPTATSVEDDENDVEELEILIEAYFMQINHTLNRLGTVCEYVDATDDYINIQLDDQRNQLIQVDLIFRSVHVCVTMYSMIAGMFAMNIPFTWNNGHKSTFSLVVSLSGTFCAVLFVIILSYARCKGAIG